MNLFKPWLATTLTVFFVALVVVIWKILIPMYFPGTLPNYAQEVAKPLDAEMLRAGATKKSENGNAGSGFGNSNPYIHMSYLLFQDKALTVEKVNRIMQDNGFKLTHATPSNKGNLEYVVGDEYIDAWYFDNSSKQNPYRDLLDGPIEIAVKIGDAQKQDAPGETTVRIDVRLPAFKR